MVTNLNGDRLCLKELICCDCPFKLGFHGQKHKLCYQGFFRKNRHNHKKLKHRNVEYMRY
jgi:hypothetical protein